MTSYIDWFRICLSKENKFVAILTAWCKLSDKTLTSDIFNAFFLEIITIFLKKNVHTPAELENGNMASKSTPAFIGQYRWTYVNHFLCDF